MCQNTNGPFSPLEKTRWVIKDSAVWSGLKWAVDWTPMDESILDTRAYTTTSAYDALNRVRILTYPEDANSQRQELSPRYNRAGALVRIDLQGAPVLEHLAYNAKGQRILVARPNGFHTRYAYDPITFRLQRIRTERFSQSGNTYTPLSGNVRQDTGYEYDLGGNIIKVKERVADCGINGSLLGSDALDKAFEYDPLKRLLKATGREGGGKWNGDHWRPVNAGTASPNANNVRAYTRRYSYDKVGNVQDLVHQAISNNYTRHYNYLSGKNHLASIDSGGSPPSVNASFLYDLNGNWVKTDTTRYYGWNAGDEMAFYKLQVSGSAVSMQSHHFYSGGQRVKKLIRNGTGDILEATVYIDGIFEHRYNTNQQQTSLLVMDGRSKIATVRAGDPMEGNIPYVTYELEDHLGSSTVRLDAYGAFVDSEEYYPFGESSLLQYGLKRYGYVGKEYERESGLLYYGARFYAAWTCRFISVDPLADKYAQLTPYNYAGNKPIGDLDIDGMQGTGDTPSNPASSDIGNEEFNQRAQDALKSNPTTFELEFSTDGVNSYGSITTDGNTECYDSNVGFTDPAGNVLQKANTQGGLSIPQRDAEGLLILPENPPEGESANAQKGEPQGPSLTNEPTASPSVNSTSSAAVQHGPNETKPPSTSTPAEGKDVWPLMLTLGQGYVEKTERLFEKGGKPLAKATRFLGKVSKGLGWLGIIAVGWDAYNTLAEDGVNWKAVTKVVIGGGLAVAGVIAAVVSAPVSGALAIAGFAYGVLDYFGVIDKALDGMERVWKRTTEYGRDIWDKTKSGFIEMENRISRTGRPFAM